MSVTVRISEPLRETLRCLAAREGVPMQTVLEKAVESYHRNSLLGELNAAYARLGDATKAELDQELQRVEKDREHLASGLYPVRPGGTAQSIRTLGT